MKAGAALLGLLWLAASAFAGYRLTERSFAWVDLPDFGLPPLALPTPAAAVQAGLQAAQKNAPSAIQQQLSRLTPPQLACLQASISPSRVSAVLSGHMTAQEAAAIQTCLK